MSGHESGRNYAPGAVRRWTGDASHWSRAIIQEDQEGQGDEVTRPFSGDLVFYLLLLCVIATLIFAPSHRPRYAIACSATECVRLDLETGDVKGVLTAGERGVQ